MFNGKPSKANLYRYRGIFGGPMDYGLALGGDRLASIAETAGLPPTDLAKENRERLKRLEQLGGVRKSLSNQPITNKEYRKLISIGRKYTKSLAKSVA